MINKKYIQHGHEIVIKYNNPGLLRDIQALIEKAKRNVATAVNSVLTILYWRIGKKVREQILQEKRAEYGKEILPTLSAKLMPFYGSGFSERNLARMIKMAEYFTDEQIVHTLSKHLGWDANLYLSN